jgi:glucose-6-phosphate isomerase
MFPAIFTVEMKSSKISMLPKKNPTQTKAWKELKSHFQKVAPLRMVNMFKENPNRAKRFTLQHDGLLLDFSKNRITEETMDLLIDLANEVQLKQAIQAMFTGAKINETENRSVLHTALRKSTDNNLEIDGLHISEAVENVLQKVEKFSNKITTGNWKGFSGKRISDIVNIGIGGSDLGPAMVCEALTPYKIKKINTHFVSNIDSSHLTETIKKVNAETTLFVISSKTFTTQETMTNAWSARKWFLESATEADIAKHFVAVSTNKAATSQFGIEESNVFEFWDWVGGRYSVWSAIGLTVACGLGFENFKKFLDGAASMDKHFLDKPFRENIPVILALISIWYVNFFNCTSEAILPYDQYFDKLVDYLQQVIMESNGKSVDRNGERVSYNTCPVIWGAPGTNSQHSFFQLLHQGSQVIPCDFITTMKSQNPLGDHKRKLLANFFGQTRALMVGKSREEVSEEMQRMGFTDSEIERIGPHKVFEGNRPSNSIIIEELNPYSLGMLLAMYEHKVFVQGIVWNIFSFDQWGVELGKQIAKLILPALENDNEISSDGSTQSLISHFKNIAKQ